MSAGASGGADIEGRAFDAGPTAQNESAASIGEAAGLSGQAARDYGMAQLDALDAQHGTNFGQRARGLTGNNSIGTAELESFGFDAGAPAGLQHAHQRAPIEQAIFNPSTMMAQVGQLKQKVGPNTYELTDIDVPYSVLSPSTAIAPLDPGWNPGSNFGIPAAILGGIGALGVTQGIDVASQTPGSISSFLDAFEDRQKAIQEAYNARYGPSPNYGMGVGGGPDAAQMSLDDFGIAEGLGEALATNLYSFPNQYLDYYEIEDFGPTLEFDTTIPNPAFDPENIQNNPQDVWDAIDSIPNFNLSSLDDAVFDLDTAIASTSPNAFESAFGIGYSGVSPDMGAVSQEGGEALQEALAQRAAETIIAQQAVRQVTPESNKVTIPVSSGPDIVIDAAPSSVRVAAKSIAKPKQFKKLPKVSQKQIRQGKVPTGGSDYVQDMVRNFLAPPTPPTRPSSASR